MNEREPLPRIPDVRPVQRPARAGAAAPTPRPFGAAAISGAEGTPIEQAEQRQARKAADPKAMEQALRQLTDFAQNFQRSLQFSVDKASGQTVVRVLDATTKEVIRQIPSEEFLAIAERIRQQAEVGSGLLVKESV